MKLTNHIKHFDRIKLSIKKFDNYFTFFKNLFIALKKDYDNIVENENTFSEQLNLSKKNPYILKILKQNNIIDVGVNIGNEIKELVFNQLSFLKNILDDIEGLKEDKTDEELYLEYLVDDLFDWFDENFDIFNY